MIRKRCIHYEWQGDYSLDICLKDGRHPRTNFDCKDCNDFITHVGKGLRKCPFCGGGPYLDKPCRYGEGPNGIWEIFCQKCHVSMKQRGSKKVIDAWNRRQRDD